MSGLLRITRSWIGQNIWIFYSAQTLSLIQSIGIICAIAISVYTVRVESRRESADLMLKFDDRLNSGKSALVVNALELNGNLNRAKNVDDEALDEFLGNYELLDTAYRNGLIDNDMAYDAFSYDLEKALQDAKVKAFLLASRSEEGDIYDGVLELARSFGIGTYFLTATPTGHASP